MKIGKVLFLLIFLLSAGIFIFIGCASDDRPSAVFPTDGFSPNISDPLTAPTIPNNYTVKVAFATTTISNKFTTTGINVKWTRLSDSKNSDQYRYTIYFYKIFRNDKEIGILSDSTKAYTSNPELSYYDNNGLAKGIYYYQIQAITNYEKKSLKTAPSNSLILFNGI
ncbi:hypothetical protein HZA55_09360 [Candidatus Poribacteria bacterium]|nr:hypothetical protein [Candidatus Poribacteria bacterium]